MTDVLRRFMGGLVLVSLAMSTAAQAVVVGATYDAPTRVAPSNNPYWNNVAHLADASAVYLGNGWMITAQHVNSDFAAKTVTFADGRQFGIVPDINSQKLLVNADGASLADLRMFRLTSDPGLPALPLVTSTPTIGSNVMMIGAGRDRSATIIGWQITGVSPDLTWVQSPLPFDGAEGFSLLSSSHIAWGQSQVTGGQTVLTGSPVMFGNVSVPTMTAEFSTTFFRFGLPFSASAVPGDSGGAVFQSVNGKWQLAGIMDAVAAPLPGAPPSTVIYGQQTFSADISAYLNDINGVLHPAAPATPASQVNPPVQATANATQATAAPSVASQDLSQLLTTLETVGPHAVSGTADALQDMNGDGFISAMDALLLAHRLSELTPAAAPLAIANLAVVPEPSGAALGVLGLVLVAAARVMLAARRQSMGP